MSVFKDKTNGRWYVMVWYVNWKGERKQKCKRGFVTKKDAQAWEQMFKMQAGFDLNMSFAAFTEIYRDNIKNRLKRILGKQKKISFAQKYFPILEI